jgi:hypothetical protein
MKDLGSLFECTTYSDGFFELALSKGITDYGGCPMNIRLEYLWRWMVMMVKTTTASTTQVCMYNNLELLSIEDFVMKESCH